jgi:hypothetical protein
MLSETRWCWPGSYSTSLLARIGICDSLTRGEAGVARGYTGLGYAGRWFKGCVEPFGRVRVGFILVVGKTEAGGACLLHASARQAVTRLGMGINWNVVIVIAIRFFTKWEWVSPSTAISVCQGVHTRRRVGQTSCVRFFIATRLRR